MMKISSVISIIEEIAHPAMQASWDRSGLQVACLRDQCRHLAVMLDALPQQIEKALASGADFILCHHPLSLKPDLPCKVDNYYKLLRLLLVADAPLYAAHTSLDVNLAGPAGWLGRELGLSDVLPLEKVENIWDAGCGYGGVGALPQAMRLGDLTEKIMRLAQVEYACAIGNDPERMCRRVAWCGGSGASLAPLARKLVADLFVTGDLKYHAALEAEIPILDVGHHSLEEKMMRIFARDLQEKLADMRVEFFPSQSPFAVIRA